ncbi:MAG: endonuclease/exonuclease/phosphatase family protein, partial [Thermoanaerobaculia bacterium]
AAGSNVRLLLDWDGSADTGLPMAGLGVDLESRLGERQLFEYDPAGGRLARSPGTGKVTALPTHSAEAFEIRVALPPALRPNKKSGAGGAVRFFLVDEQQGGDRLPDSGSVSYQLSGTPVGPVEPIELERRKPENLRLLSLNMADTSIAAHPERYRRLLRALKPDILSFQEVRDWSVEQLRAFVAQLFPGRTWHAQGVADCVTVSPYPIVGSAAVDQNLLVHIDLPAWMGRRDLVLFNVHLPCCSNDADRDRESDNIAAAWRDLLAGQGPFPIDAANDAVVVLGDFNFVGFRRQLRAIRRGIFIDSTLGPNFAPGRANGSLSIARARRTHANTVTTWRRNGSAFAPGRLDFVFFGRDALRQVKSYSLDTTEMDNRFRRSHNLRHGDSVRISDHLPLIADFELRK